MLATLPRKLVPVNFTHLPGSNSGLVWSKVPKKIRFASLDLVAARFVC